MKLYTGSYDAQDRDFDDVFTSTMLGIFMVAVILVLGIYIGITL